MRALDLLSVKIHWYFASCAPLKVPSYDGFLLRTEQSRNVALSSRIVRNGRVLLGNCLASKFHTKSITKIELKFTRHITPSK